MEYPDSRIAVIARKRLFMVEPLVEAKISHFGQSLQ